MVVVHTKKMPEVSKKESTCIFNFVVLLHKIFKSTKDLFSASYREVCTTTGGHTETMNKMTFLTVLHLQASSIFVVVKETTA